MSPSLGVAAFDRVRTGILCFSLGLFLTLWSLTPATISGMGYTAETMRAGDSLLTYAHMKLLGRPVPDVTLTRNGPLPLLLDLPYLLIGKRVVSEDFLLSFEPIVDTTLLMTILLLWLQKLTSQAMAVFLTLSTVFGTLIWPYAYIGLETKQSLFLLGAAYLAFQHKPLSSPWQALIFGFCSCYALGSKANGLMLLPAVILLVVIAYRKGSSFRRVYLSTGVAVIGLITWYCLYEKNRYWVETVHMSTAVRFFTLQTTSIFHIVGNLVGLLGSPTKGLLLFAPLLVASALSISSAWQTHRELTLFALLVLGGLMLGFATNVYYVDETWGPRYLHSAISPLVLIIGAARADFRIRRDWILVPLVGWGMLVSFLGAFFYYGNLDAVASLAEQNTLGELVGDQEWNSITFNARLFSIWKSHRATPAPWTPSQRWIWTRPADVPEPRTVDLAPYAVPQPFLIRSFGAELHGASALGWRLLLIAALFGPLLLFAASLILVKTVSRRNSLALPAP